MRSERAAGRFSIGFGAEPSDTALRQPRGSRGYRLSPRPFAMPSCFLRRKPLRCVFPSSANDENRIVCSRERAVHPVWDPTASIARYRLIFRAGSGRRFRLQPLAFLLPALVAMGSWMERNAGDGHGLVHAVVNRARDRMTPRTLPSARFVIEEQDPSGWFPSPPRVCSPRLLPYETLAWSRALGAGSTRAPLPSVFSFGPKGGRGAPVGFCP